VMNIKATKVGSVIAARLRINASMIVDRPIPSPGRSGRGAGSFNLP
jgi:hypothetical protein